MNETKKCLLHNRMMVMAAQAKNDHVGHSMIVRWFAWLNRQEKSTGPSRR